MPEKPVIKTDASGRKYIKKDGKRHYLKRESKKVTRKKKPTKKTVKKKSTKTKRSSKRRVTKKVVPTSHVIHPASGSSVSTAAMLGMMSRPPVVVDSGSKIDADKISKGVAEGMKALMSDTSYTQFPLGTSYPPLPPGDEMFDFNLDEGRVTMTRAEIEKNANELTRRKRADKEKIDQQTARAYRLA